MLFILIHKIHDLGIRFQFCLHRLCAILLNVVVLKYNMEFNEVFIPRNTLLKFSRFQIILFDLFIHLVHFFKLNYLVYCLSYRTTI